MALGFFEPSAFSHPTSGTGQYKDFNIVPDLSIFHSAKPASSGSSTSNYYSAGAASSPSVSADIDYLNADLARHYGMSASTAYQEALSNTSYQRAVRDLKASGLNPILAYTHLGGANGVNYVGSDNSSNSASSYSYSGSRSSKKSGFDSDQLFDTVATAAGGIAGYVLSGGNVMAAAMAANTAHFLARGASSIFS